MTSNPYESSRVETTGRRAVRLEDRRRGPWEMALAGFGAGLMIGGSCGAVAAGGLTLMCRVWIELDLGRSLENALFYIVESTFLGTVAGCLLGLVAGGLLGPMLGLAAVGLGPRRGWVLHGLAILSCGAAGTLGGFLGGAAQKFHPDDPTLMIASACIGLICGIVGGVILGRGLGILAWGPSKQTQALANESRVSP